MSPEGSPSLPAIFDPDTPECTVPRFDRHLRTFWRDTHSLGCHRPRIPDAVVFNHLIDALGFDVGHERIADEAISATTMRRRRNEQIHAGLSIELAALAVSVCDAMIGLDLNDIAVNGYITKGREEVSSLTVVPSTAVSAS